jgi:ABC-type glycerol-3-phosphate transport system substrate-binding protein
MLTGDRVYLSHFAQNLKFDWGLVPLPMNPEVTPRTVGTGHYFGIANSSPNVEAAWTFLKWVTGPKGHNMVKAKAPLPGNLKAFPIYQAFWDAKRAEWNVPKNIDLVAQVTTYAVAPSITRTTFSQQQVATLLRNVYNGIMQRQVAAETAVQELQRQLEALSNQ